MLVPLIKNNPYPTRAGLAGAGPDTYPFSDAAIAAIAPPAGYEKLMISRQFPSLQGPPPSNVPGPIEQWAKSFYSWPGNVDEVRLILACGYWLSDPQWGDSYQVIFAKRAIPFPIGAPIPAPTLVGYIYAENLKAWMAVNPGRASWQAPAQQLEYEAFQEAAFYTALQSVLPPD